MTSFSLKIETRRGVFLKLVRDIQHSLNSALLEEYKKRGLTRAAIATTLGKNKSVITRAFQNTGNLTLETLADIAFALGREPNFNFEKSLELASSTSELSSRVSNSLKPPETEQVNMSNNIIMLYSSGSNSSLHNRLSQIPTNRTKDEKVVVYLDQSQVNNARLNASQVAAHNEVA